MPEADRLKCDCDGGCIRCLIARGETEGLAETDLADARRTRCMVCDCELTIAGGYYGTGMCGPCCTGESATLAEKGTHW